MGGICCLLWLLIGACSLYNCYGTERVSQYETAELIVDTSSGRPIPDTLFGIFFEEINHAGSGGLWAELVSNRGFEAGGLHAPSNINPWSIIGDETTITVMTELSSCFERNKMALRIDVLCDNCPTGGVGVYNPGFWGMNIEQGKTYKVVFYVRSTRPINVDVSLTSSDGGQILATSNVIADANEVANWTKMEVMLEATSSNSNSRLQLTTLQKGTLWIDQVSAMPMDTYKGHGFRKDLFEKLAALEPRFLRFPGGCYVEGEWLRNAFRWKETVGPWENRPGHFGDVWMYWTDDGLGYFEFLQLAEDLGAAPIWVINNGISHQDQVDTSVVSAFVQEMLDSIEFARGSALSQWGSLRAAMGHPEPFELKYIAVGNEDCQKPHYRGNYLKYFVAIKKAYPDIQVISNCDASSTPLDHPADMYDFHIYTLNAYEMFLENHKFDNTRRSGPKAFVSEYAVRGKDAGTGSLLAALAEAAFLIGIERNSDVIQMASYAPLFVNANDRRWNPDAIVFDSSRVYGTPSYWVQQFFTKSSGATLLNSSLLASPSASLVSSAVRWKNATNNKNYITIKILNYANNYVILKLSFGVNKHSVLLSGSRKTVLASSNIMDENSFQNPDKVVPASGEFQINAEATYTLLQPYSFTSFDVVQEQADYISLKEEDSGQIYSF